MRTLLACVALLALFSSIAPAQPSAGQIVIVNEGGFYGNSIVAMGRYGIEGARALVGGLDAWVEAGGAVSTGNGEAESGSEEAAPAGEAEGPSSR